MITSAGTTYALATTDVFVRVATSGTTTLTLPTSPVDGFMFFLHYCGTSSTYTITLTIPGSETYTLNSSASSYSITNIANYFEAWTYTSSTNNWSYLDL